MRNRLLCAALLAAPLWAQQETPETILHNGKIVTLWEASPQAQAVAIRDGRFAAVGSNEEVLRLAGPATRRIDLHGRTVVPGLIDSHTHPIGAALSEQQEEIPVIGSIAELQQHITRVARATPPSKLIFVPKIYATRMKEGRYPTRQDLDQAGGADRVIVADNGYAAVLNSGALKKAGITRDTPQPANGKIIKDSAGEPTGLILGAPQLLSAFRSNRPTTHEDRLWALQAMQKRYNEAGLTSTIDRGQQWDGLRAYQELWRKGELTVRTYVTYMAPMPAGPLDRVRDNIDRIPVVTGFGDDWLRIGSLKIVLDGGILIGTAYLREPYGEHTEVYGYQDPDYRGVLAVPRENVFAIASLANRLGWQMTAHSTGGGSTDLLMDAYEAADRERSIRQRRFTLTHANFPNAALIARAKRLGVVLDMQPAWMHLDGAALLKVLGPARMKDFHPYKSLFDAGVVVAGGSDHMIKFDSRHAINPFNPFFGMWMTVTRKLTDGTVLDPEQKITREQALRMWTLNAAYLSFDEKRKGSIEPGKLADLVVLSRDILTCSEEEIRTLEAEATMVGGKFVYSRNPM
ncbi:MAG: amidohydrolase [Acidobacteria bacterium]|nr:amidohydrolase [Acidobacteriota bacterium]